MSRPPILCSCSAYSSGWTSHSASKALRRSDDASNSTNPFRCGMSGPWRGVGSMNGLRTSGDTYR
eukprot:1601109-Rhodomonas_salina.2